MSQPDTRTNLQEAWDIVHESGIENELGGLGIWIRLSTVPQNATNVFTPLEREFFPPHILESLRTRHEQGQQIIKQSGIEAELGQLGFHLHTHTTS